MGDGAQIDCEHVAVDGVAHVCHIHGLTLVDEREGLGQQPADVGGEFHLHRLHLSIAHTEVGGVLNAVELHGNDVERGGGLGREADGISGSAIAYVVDDVNHVLMRGPLLVNQCGPCLPDVAQRQHCSVVACHLDDSGITAGEIGTFGVCPPIFAGGKSQGIYVVVHLGHSCRPHMDGCSGAIVEVEHVGKVRIVLLVVDGPSVVGIGISIHLDAAYQLVDLHLAKQREIWVVAHCELRVTDIIVDEVTQFT